MEAQDTGNFSSQMTIKVCADLLCNYHLGCIMDCVYSRSVSMTVTMSIGDINEHAPDCQRYRALTVDEASGKVVWPCKGGSGIKYQILKSRHIQI